MLHELVAAMGVQMEVCANGAILPGKGVKGANIPLVYNGNLIYENLLGGEDEGDRGDKAFTITLASFRMQADRDRPRLFFSGVEGEDKGKEEKAGNSHGEHDISCDRICNRASRALWSRR